MMSKNERIQIRDSCKHKEDCCWLMCQKSDCIRALFYEKYGNIVFAENQILNEILQLVDDYSESQL
jgi:hypothetical protein